jgi:hypothetical protein
MDAWFICFDVKGKEFHMSSKISIKNRSWSNGDLHLVGENIEMDASTLKPAARVLADSDNLAFIYILETPDKYIYLSIGKEYWSDLKMVLKDNASVILMINQHEFKLEGIAEELKELIDNIKDNANYGEDMVNEVESQFL